MSLDTCQGMTWVQVTYNQSIIFQNNNVYFHFYRFLLVCTRLTFDLVLRPRVIYRLGIHPYEFGHMPRNIMSICRIMYSKMPTKPKLSHFFGFGLPSIRLLGQLRTNLTETALRWRKGRFWAKVIRPRSFIFTRKAYSWQMSQVSYRTIVPLVNIYYPFHKGIRNPQLPGHRIDGCSYTATPCGNVSTWTRSEN